MFPTDRPVNVDSLGPGRFNRDALFDPDDVQRLHVQQLARPRSGIDDPEQIRGWNCFRHAPPVEQPALVPGLDFLPDCQIRTRPDG